MARGSLVFACVLLSAAAARAQDNSGAAHALFDEAKRLYDKGDFAAACAKFRASLDLENGLGTRLALATCYERAGRTASAWAEFRDAAAMAGRAGGAEAAREKFARDHAAALEGRLVRLVINAPAGVLVKRDGAPVPIASLAIAVPVDPGLHDLTASADGYEPWSQKVTVGPVPLTTVTVPPLRKIEAPPPPIETNPPPNPPPPQPPPIEPAPPVVPAPATAAEGGTPTLRYVGYGVGAAGLVLVGVGVAVGASASSKWSDAKAMCGTGAPPLQCTPAGVQLHDDAVSAARLATIATIGGVAAIGGGVLLVLFAPDPPPPGAVAIHPGFGTGGPSVVVEGSF
jgi:serine/threonine-protein kinase